MPDRRLLNFSTFQDVADDINRLRAGGYERAGGWSLAQACRHLDHSLQFSMRPGPHPANTPEQDANAAKCEQILASGRLPSGIPAPPHMMPPDDAGDADIDAFLVTLRRYDEFPGPVAPHRLFGHRSQAELRRIALIHCAHHLSHLVPKTGATPAAAQHSTH